MDVIHPRCAGLDISKKDAKVCVRINGAGRRKTSQTVTTYGTAASPVDGTFRLRFCQLKLAGTLC